MGLVLISMIEWKPKDECKHVRYAEEFYENKEDQGKPKDMGSLDFSPLDRGIVDDSTNFREDDMTNNDGIMVYDLKRLDVFLYPSSNVYRNETVHSEERVKAVKKEAKRVADEEAKKNEKEMPKTDISNKKDKKK